MSYNFRVSVYGNGSDYRSRRLSSMVLQLAEGHVIGQVSSLWFGVFFFLLSPHWSLSTRSPSPFLFVRGLSCPSCIQALLSLNCLKLTMPGFPYNCLPVSCGDVGFKKKSNRSSIGLEIRSQSAFTAFTVLFPSANYSKG